MHRRCNMMWCPRRNSSTITNKQRVVQERGSLFQQVWQQNTGRSSITAYNCNASSFVFSTWFWKKLATHQQSSSTIHTWGASFPHLALFIYPLTLLFFPFNPTVYFTQLANHNSKEYPCKSTTYQPSSPIKQNKIDIIISSLPYPTRRTNQDDQVCASQHSTARIC